MLFDVQSGTHTWIAREAGRWSQAPSINADGTRIAFTSEADLVPGGNPQRRFHVYLATCRNTDVLLRENRFRVAVDWRRVDGQQGQGTGARFSDESAYFWFFAPGNIELLVKVLDGSSPRPAPWSSACRVPSGEHGTTRCRLRAK